MTAAPPTSPVHRPRHDDLHAAVALYEAALPSGIRHVFDAAPLDVIGFPVITDVLVWDGIWHDGHGYGATALEAAVGALGELSEFVHLDRALRDDPGFTATFEDLVAREGEDRVLDPRALCLGAGNPWRPSDPMRWMRVSRWPEGEAFVPREFVAANPHAFQWGERAPLDPIVTPITNGLGAGSSLEQALAHGLLELLQRDGNTTRFRAMDRGTVIDIDGVRDPGVLQIVERLRAAGVEPLAKLASTEFGLTNLYVVDGGSSEPPLPLQATGCGEAVHPDREVALRKALLEFAASRCRKAMMHGPLPPVAAIAPPAYLDAVVAAVDPAEEEPRAFAAMLDWMGRSAVDLRALLAGTVRSERERVAFSDLPTTPAEAVRDPADRLADLARRLDAAGLPIFYYDASPPGGPAVVKAIVPGLECETMSYHRIGARGLERLAREPAPSGRLLAGFGPPPPGAKPVRLSPQDEARFGPGWLDTAAVDAEVGPLYPLYREPNSHAVAVELQRRRVAAE